MQPPTFLTLTQRQVPRRRLAIRATSVLAVGAALALAVPATAGAAPSSARQLERLAVDGVPYEPSVEPLRLDCTAAASTETAGVRCNWSIPTSDGVVGVRLVRVAVGAGTPRATVFRTEDLDVNSFADTAVRPGARYAYAVQGLSAVGRVLASSRTEHVVVPQLEAPAVEGLRLECAAADTAPGERGRVACEWSLPADATPRVITLWRSVDGAERERVASFTTPFATSYRDGVPAGTSRVVYAVIGTDGDGEIVARSRAEAVTFRTGDGPQRTTLAEAVAPTTEAPVPAPEPGVAVSPSSVPLPKITVPPTTITATVVATTVPPARTVAESERERSRRGDDG